MPAYLALDIEWHDPAAMAAYRQAVAPSLARHGAKLLMRGTNTIALEGDWRPVWLVVFEFESVVRALEWYNSEEYRAILPQRLAASTAKVILVESFDAGVTLP